MRQWKSSLKDVKMFEKQNPNIPGISVFSINDQNIIYPLRLSEKDCQRSIDLFLCEKRNRKHHHSIIKDFGRLPKSHISNKQHKKKKLMIYENEEMIVAVNAIYAIAKEA